MMSGFFRYNIFISHAWKHDDDYYKIIKLLDADRDFSYLNYSLPDSDFLLSNEKNREHQKELIHSQIEPVDVVLILSSMYLKDPEWIQFQIDVALSYKKPIIGIKPWSASEIPAAIKANAHEVVGWDTPSLVYAISKRIK